MQNDINSLLQFKEQISHNLSLISDEQASLNTLVQNLIDDNAEKGKRQRKGKEPQVAQQEIRGRGRGRNQISETSMPAPTVPTSTAPTKTASSKLSAEEKAQGESDLIQLMAEAGYTADEYIDEGKQRIFLAELKKQKQKEKAQISCFKGLESSQEERKKRDLTDWLPEKEQFLWDELVSIFILQHYWLQIDSRYTGDTQRAFHIWLQNYPDRTFIKRIREKATREKITLNPPQKDTFVPPTVHGTDIPDIDAVNSFIRRIAAQYGCKSTVSELYTRIRDSIYAAMGIMNKEQIAEERARNREGNLDHLHLFLVSTL